MGYKRSTSILPPELIQRIQKYVDGEYIYIPRSVEKKETGEIIRIPAKYWH